MTFDEYKKIHPKMLKNVQEFFKTQGFDVSKFRAVVDSTTGEIKFKIDVRDTGTDKYKKYKMEWKSFASLYGYHHDWLDKEVKICGNDTYIIRGFKSSARVNKLVFTNKNTGALHAGDPKKLLNSIKSQLEVA